MARKRKPRLEQAVREAIAELLDEEIADPRVEHVTITDARVSEDQRHAIVYYTTLDQDLIARDQGHTSSGMPRSPQEAHEGLLSAAPRLQGLLARRVRMRHTPTIAFEPDQIAAEARRIDELLRGARSSSPGGDGSPYPSVHDPVDEGGETT
ncbi:MAG: 30S ribosome-binding factor RbfA [Actinomycetota bacterium]|nr:30S ribosome-binding factor RbfA [Actinomycetota bacterium]